MPGMQWVHAGPSERRSEVDLRVRGVSRLARGDCHRGSGTRRVFAPGLMTVEWTRTASYGGEGLGRGLSLAPGSVVAL